MVCARDVTKREAGSAHFGRRRELSKRTKRVEHQDKSRDGGEPVEVQTEAEESVHRRAAGGSIVERNPEPKPQHRVFPQEVSAAPEVRCLIGLCRLPYFIEPDENISGVIFSYNL